MIGSSAQAHWHSALHVSWGGQKWIVWTACGCVGLWCPTLRATHWFSAFQWQNGTRLWKGAGSAGCKWKKNTETRCIRSKDKWRQCQCQFNIIVQNYFHWVMHKLLPAYAVKRQNSLSKNIKAHRTAKYSQTEENFEMVFLWMSIKGICVYVVYL